MRISEAKWKQSPEWLSDMSNAFTAGLAGESIPDPDEQGISLSDEQLEDLISKLNDKEKTHLISMLQHNLDPANTPVDKDLENAKAWQRSADKFSANMDKVGDAMRFASGLLGTGKVDNMKTVKLDRPQDFLAIIKKIERDEKINEAEFRLLTRLLIKIPDTPQYRQLKRTVKGITDGEQPSTLELARFRQFINLSLE